MGLNLRLIALSPNSREAKFAHPLLCNGVFPMARRPMATQ